MLSARLGCNATQTNSRQLRFRRGFFATWSRSRTRLLYSRNAMADSNVGAEKHATRANLATQIDAGKHKHISSSWVTLGNELFRVLWIASVVSNIGTMM